MIFRAEKLEELKNETSSDIFKILKVNTGISCVLGAVAGISAIAGNIPILAFASIGMISKFPNILNGFKYLENEAKSVLPEYRVLLKDKKMRAYYEDQFAKLSIDYIDNSSTELEKRFKTEFLTEWLHVRDIYMLELKKSGLTEYSINLQSNLKKSGLYEDRTIANVDYDMGVTFGGLCNNDNYSRLQKQIYAKDFINEGIVAGMILKGATSNALEDFLALQDYKLTKNDIQIIETFVKMDNKEFVKSYQSEKLSSINITQKSMEMIETGLKMNNKDGLKLAEMIIKMMNKADEVQKFYKKNNPSNANNPVSIYPNFKTDLMLFSQQLKSQQMAGFSENVDKIINSSLDVKLGKVGSSLKA